MFRLLSRPEFKAVPEPRAGLRISNSTTSRHVHSMQAPYSRPPSYNMIARRFSLSQVDPKAYFTRRRNRDARGRGEYVDIHDIGCADPTGYDVLIMGLSHKTLETSIAKELAIPYLSKATDADAKKVVKLGEGYIYGRNHRPIIPLVVSFGDEARWVFFIRNTGTP